MSIDDKGLLRKDNGFCDISPCFLDGPGWPADDNKTVLTPPAEVLCPREFSKNESIIILLNNANKNLLNILNSKSSTKGIWRFKIDE